MVQTFKINPVLRAVLVIAAVAALVTSVTFAALSSSATLTNNSISSATASLLVKSTGDFATQDTGFAFTSVVPGGDPVPDPGHSFQLMNDGEVDMDISVSIPTAPTFGTATVDLSKVDLILDCTAGSNTFSLTSDIQALVTAHPDGVLMTTGFLPSGETDNIAECTAQVQMEADAVSGDFEESSNFNIVFTGSPHTGEVTPPPPPPSPSLEE